METIFAFCITGLFSVWIWSLKSAVADLQKRAPMSAHNGPRHDLPPMRTLKIKDGDGSMIWTIE
ncbi:MAG: hypothetical protein V1873_04620 [Verrucomicrobiota bacterium]